MMGKQLNGSSSPTRLTPETAVRGIYWKGFTLSCCSPLGEHLGQSVGMMAQSCDTRTQEVEMKSKNLTSATVRSTYETSLGYVRP